MFKMKINKKIIKKENNKFENLIKIMNLKNIKKENNKLENNEFENYKKRKKLKKY